MFEHPQVTYDAIVAEQQRIDRANELRRIIADNPERVVLRQHPILDRLRNVIPRGRTNAATKAVASESPREICDPTARAAHAR